MFLDLHLRTLTPHDKEELVENLRKAGKSLGVRFESHYQTWYTEALAVIRQLMGDRLSEFTQLYHGEGKRKSIHHSTYHIQDRLRGERATEIFTGKKNSDDFGITYSHFHMQLEIVKSIQSRFESSLFDIVQVGLTSSIQNSMPLANLLNTDFFVHRELSLAWFWKST